MAIHRSAGQLIKERGNSSKGGAIHQRAGQFTKSVATHQRGWQFIGLCPSICGTAMLFRQPDKIHRGYAAVPKQQLAHRRHKSDTNKTNPMQKSMTHAEPRVTNRFMTGSEGLRIHCIRSGRSETQNSNTSKTVSQARTKIVSIIAVFYPTPIQICFPPLSQELSNRRRG